MKLWGSHRQQPLSVGRAASFFSSEPASASPVTRVSLCPDNAVISSFTDIVRFADIAEREGFVWMLHTVEAYMTGSQQETRRCSHLLRK